MASRLLRTLPLLQKVVRNGCNIPKIQPTFNITKRSFMIHIPGDDDGDDSDNWDDDFQYSNLEKNTMGELTEFLDDIEEMGSDQYPGFRKVMITWVYIFMHIKFRIYSR
jgi:hypothetical protein